MSTGTAAVPRPGVGLAVIIVNPSGKVLVGERMGSHGSGTVALPGGHLEQGEDWATCAEREVLEETGLETQYVGQVAVTNDVFVHEKKHYVTIFVVCSLKDPANATPQVLEKDKCRWWDWKDWDWMRNECPNRFLPMTNLLNEHPDIDERVAQVLSR